MKRMKKTMTLLVIFIMVSLALPVSAQAQSRKAAVNKTVNTFFANAGKLNSKKMNKCFVSKGVLIFDAPAGLRKELRPYSKNLSWKIKSTRITGNKAKVRVRVKYRSLSKAYLATLFTVVESEEGSKKDSVYLMWLKKYAQEAFRKFVKQFPPDEVTANLSISLQKKNGKWKITEAEDRLFNVIYCDLLLQGKSQEAYEKEGEDIEEKLNN
ncbi:MAG: hypothetical protein UDG86_08755 [Lachnospiraceae bacterium]|nr:hypothetical protein [Lachnospiraceae bacterium]